MARGNRRRRSERSEAINAGEARQAGGVAEDLRDEADATLAEKVSMPVEDREAIDAGLTEEMEQERREEEADELGRPSPDELIEALEPLRATRANPLTAGISVFTSMLEQARAGYAADRLAELEAALDVVFNTLEQSGILQIAMANMGDDGVPDVEHGIRLCLEAWAQVEEAVEAVAEDHGDDESQNRERPPLHSIVRIDGGHVYGGYRAKVQRKLVDGQVEVELLDHDREGDWVTVPDEAVEVVSAGDDESQVDGATEDLDRARHEGAEEEIAAEEADSDKPGPED